MTEARFSFGEFSLDAGERQLLRGAERVEVNGRYLDALLLLVREAGRLVSKDRFMEEVWRGVPVTDEALTQCIRSLRRLLGDEAGRPRFIETVPRHGYRFIAPVSPGGEVLAEVPSVGWEHRARVALAGTAGGAGAGLAGGLVYGFMAAGQQQAGGASIVAVVTCVTVLVAALGAAGVAGGIAAVGLERPVRWSMAGGALGGMLVGALFRLVGLDAFAVLLGRAPTGVAGPFEGVLLGGAVGLGAGIALANRSWSFRRRILVAGSIGSLAGLVIPLLGGRLMAGSLQRLAEVFPGSRLRLEGLGSVLGERGFGPISQAVTGAAEGALFAGCIAAAMSLAAARLLRG